MTTDKYSRENFITKNNIDGNIENDLASNHFNDFVFSRARNFYKITKADVSRPELISFKVYGNVNYWWIIMKLNKIDDVFNDLIPGNTLEIPSVSDIEAFYISFKKKS